MCYPITTYSANSFHMKRCENVFAYKNDIVARDTRGLNHKKLARSLASYHTYKYEFWYRLFGRDWIIFSSHISNVFWEKKIYLDGNNESNNNTNNNNKMKRGEKTRTPNFPYRIQRRNCVCVSVDLVEKFGRDLSERAFSMHF